LEDLRGKYKLASDDTRATDIKLFTISGSVTLTKKGQTWYLSDTER
jgi:hypothetical protein